MFSLIVGIIVAVAHAQFQSPPEQRTSFRDPSRFVDNILSTRFSFRSNNLIPFPQCLSSDSVSSLLNPGNLDQLFSRKLDDEERKLKQARSRNNDLNNGSTRLVSRASRAQRSLSSSDDIMDFVEMQLRSDIRNGALISRTATKVAGELLAQ